MTVAGLRVVQVLEATTGGTRKHLREVAAALPASEYAVRILCAMRRDDRFRADLAGFRAQGHEVIEVDMCRSVRPWRDLRAANRILDILRKQPCEVLHLHSAKAGGLGRWAARRLPCRVVYTPHAFPFLQRVAAPFRAAYLLAERWAARHTDLLLAVGAEEARLAVERVGFEPSAVRLLCNAIDVGAVRGEIGAISPRRDARLTIGMIADARPQKDPMTFLRAVRMARGAGLRFAVPAAGESLAMVRRFVARHDLGDDIEIVAVGDSFASLYARIDVAVLCSRWEGLPFTMLEALALRLPLIHSDIPPLREVAGAVAPELAFAPGDAAALADRMRAITRLAAEQRATIGQRGHDFVVARHGLDGWRQGLRAAYREVCERPRRNARG